MRKYLLTVFLFLLSTAIYAQAWEIGLGAGGAGYLGDLNTHNPVKISGLSATGFLKYNFNGYVGIKGALSYGHIAAADSNSSVQQQRDRNLSFSNNLLEGSVMGEFNFMNYIPSVGKNRFTPFVYLGVGVGLHDPYTRFRNGTYNLLKRETEGVNYGNKFITIPYGAGMKYNIGGKWTLMADMGYRYAFTDYLDDVSSVYLKQTDFKNGSQKNRDEGYLLSDRSNEVGVSQLNHPGTMRGDGRKRDTYFFLNLSLSFTFVTSRCYYEQSQ